jgi:amidohydrolase
LVAIIAEYDALPGLGHACGHNIIAATATGAFLALAPEVMALGGRVRLLATPAEEGGGGKEIIARAGGFDDVDCAMMIHPRDRDVAIGSWAALRQVKVGYTGLQAHAAVSPWLGRNALDAAVAAYNGIAQLRQHIHPGERVHGVFTAAGDKPNIVPHVSGLEYFLRAGDIESLERLTDQVDAVFRGAATMAGVDVDIQWDLNPVYVPVRTNVALAVRYASISTRRGRLVSLTPEVSSGSTDMGNVSVRVPSIHPSLATAPLGVGLHSAEFARQAVSAQADEAVVDGAIALASTAADFLADIDLRRAVRDEFELEGGVVDVADLKTPRKE